VSISFFLLFPVYSGDSKDMSLAKIDGLIQDTDYNVALSLLNDYIRDYPSDFDSAQRRIDKILQARRQYAELAEELISVMENEPENDKKKLDIIAELESLEKHPSAEHLSFIRQAKIAAEFTYYRAVYNKIMLTSADQVAARDYAAACDTAVTGFTLYRSEFYSQTEDTAVTDSVSQALDTITTAVESYKQLQTTLDSVTDAFITTVRSGNYEDAARSFQNVKTEFSSFATVRNAVAEAGWTLSGLFDDLKEKNSELTEASFLPFASHFTLGKSAEPDTGILGAMDAQWNTLVEKMKPELYAAITDKTVKLSELLNTNTVFTAEPGTTRNLINQMSEFAGIASAVNALYELRKQSDGSFVRHFCPKYSSSMDYITALADAETEFLSVITRYRSESGKAASYQLPQDTVSALRAENDVYADALLSSAAVFSAIVSDAKSAQTDPRLDRTSVMLPVPDNDRNGGVPAGPDTTDSTAAKGNQEQIRSTPGVQINDTELLWGTARNTYDMICTETEHAADNAAGEQWMKLASYFADFGGQVAAAFTAQFKWAQLLYSGITATTEVPVPDTPLPVPGRYPAEALSFSKELGTAVLQDKTRLVSAETTLTDGSVYADRFKTASARITDALSVLDSLQLRCSDLETNAEQQIALAKRAENEADLRLQQARTALSRENFDSARDYLQRSRTKYNESLGLQESETLRQRSDMTLEQLGSDIARLENEVVVRDVRKLKNEARSAYYDGDFEEADNLLARAKARWAVTNIDEDQEITNLSALVSTALSMKTGRVIPTTAPLYPEMSQLLSIAHQDFDEGKKLMQNGKQDEAVKILTDAKSKIRSLQLVYPLNQEASLLSLQIDQLTNPAAFTAMFERKVAAAKKDYQDPDKRRTVYTDLLDLYAINPSYPGLKQLIYTVEISIGIRQKPVDKTDFRRSKQLSDEAAAIVASAGRDEEKLREALKKADEAISLNPDNDAAVTIKDRIQTSIGGKAAVVLSAADESKYQTAIQELQKNNIIEANAIVEQLLQNETNRRSAKILDLQKRIQALL
jgi:hypothetical protein